MIIGKVVGTVICTRKNDHLIGSKFMIIEPFAKTGGENSRIVAVDPVGAGNNDIVLVAQGSAARVGCGNQDSPVDACIVGIVDDPQKIVTVD